jgi:hypothetical protein
MHGVRDHDRFDLRSAQQLDGGAAQYSMHRARMDGPRAGLLERLDRGDQRSAGGNLVLEDDCVAVLYIPHHLALRNLRIADPAFVDNRQGYLAPFGETARPLGTPAVATATGMKIEMLLEWLAMMGTAVRW